MDLAPLIPIIAIAAFAAIRIARINAGNAAPRELTGRVDELEQSVQHLQRELAETQERLDFAERLLAKGKG
jgi:hypothetical protein